MFEAMTGKVGNFSMQLHDMIKIVRHVSTVLSIVLAIPAITVIIMCSRDSKRFSTLTGIIVVSFYFTHFHQIIIQVLGVIADVVLQLIFDPLLLLPSICILNSVHLLFLKLTDVFQGEPINTITRSGQ